MLLALCGCCLFRPTPTQQSTTGQPPLPPMGLVFYSHSDNAVKLTWGYPVWEVGAIDEFKINYGVTSLGVNKTLMYTVNPLGIYQGVVPNLTSGQTYRFTCVAMRGGVASLPSNEVSYTIP